MRTDSKSAIEALQHYYPKNPLVQQIKYPFHKLYEDNLNVELCCFPAHGIVGNEEADKVAKAAICVARSTVHIPISNFFPSLNVLFLVNGRHYGVRNLKITN